MPEHDDQPDEPLFRDRKPEGMSLEEWQVALRRQHGRRQRYEAKNIGDHPVFSEYRVHNPQSGSNYRVAVRGRGAGVNYCSCPDFETNHLGTCKHIEWLLAHLEDEHNSGKPFEGEYHPPFSEVFLRYGSERRVIFRAGTECPPELVELASKHFDEEGVLRPESFARFQQFLTKAREVDHDLRCYDDVLAFIAEVRDDETRRAKLDVVFPVGEASANLQSLLREPLYRFQREGALFAARAGRCLIADDMGLGKTVEALATAEILAGEFGIEKVLVVCPTSLTHQWHREIERFTTRAALVVEGTPSQREALYRRESFYKVTNYESVPQDLPVIDAFSPDLVIVDEAQRIKNWNTRTARSVKRIDSPYAIVLTGTPLENRLEELVSIVQFVDRHRLGPTYRFLDEHQEYDEAGRVVGYRNLDDVGRTLAPVMIRRTKDAVKGELPERIEKNFFVPMTETQRRLHEHHRASAEKTLARWHRHGSLREPEQRRLMIALQNMRMACDSSFLLDHETDHSTKPDELLGFLSDLFETPGTKAVVFSQWTRALELVDRRLRDAGRQPYGYEFFHGGVASKKRRDMVRRFHDDPDCRLFLSTDAGGLGLNLQAASVVVNFDLPWNPSIREQRIARAHRIGQDRPVTVVNFVSLGTIEHGMLDAIPQKRELFEGVLDGGQSEVFLGESRFGQFMSAVEAVLKSVPDARPPVELSPQPTAVEVPAETVRDLLQSGAALLQRLTAADSAMETIRDESTGHAYLKVPLPDPQTLDEAARALRRLLDAIRGDR
jgi:hypothetical protein